MTITIYGSDYDALWQKANQSTQNNDSSNFSETLELVPESLGKGYIQSVNLHGINLMLFNYQLHEDLCIIRKRGTFDSREFGFNLSCDHYGKCKRKNFIEWGSFEAAHQRLHHSREPIQKIDIHLESAAELSQSVTEIFEELPASTRQRIGGQNLIEDVGNITPVMETAIRQIFSCSFQGKTKQIYLESKCLELISLKLEQLKQNDQKTEKLSSLKSDDIERIHFAKAILTDNFNNPPSLTKLAHQVGLNDCTLKRGFREIFGTTAFGYLHDYRLEQARILLLDNQLNVAEIAHKVGFASYRSLSRGFRKKYGVTPKKYQAQFKNSV
ncbi:MAG: AraC family transcriptional regulator [Cyanobacteria bacterium P01_C01_bin.72]